MQKIIVLAQKAQNVFDKTLALDFAVPLLLRIYLVPIFWYSATNKWDPFDASSSLHNTIYWFEHSLNMPLPTLMAYLTWATEFFGAILLALGLATRWISLPLAITMIVAAVTVHWENGWQAIHDRMSPYASGHIDAAIQRLSRARDILKEHGHYDWLTEYGNFVISNNGIKWAVTYFIMTLTLFFIGGGKYISLDYWIRRKFNR